MSGLVTLDSLLDLGVDDLAIASTRCPAMTIDIGRRAAPMLLDIGSTSDVAVGDGFLAMPLNMRTARTIRPMELDICWPPIEIVYVLDNGVIVTDENGEPVYHIIEAGGD